LNDQAGCPGETTLGGIGLFVSARTRRIETFATDIERLDFLPEANAALALLGLGRKPRRWREGCLAGRAVLVRFFLASRGGEAKIAVSVPRFRGV